MPDHQQQPPQPATPSETGLGRWYLVQTKVGLEQRAKANLERQDFGVFLPSIVRTVRHARQTQTKLVPLFPGYLFVTFDANVASWGVIDGTSGVVRLVKANGKPLPVPHGIVESLSARNTGHGLDLAKGRLAQGTTVRVLDGPFAEQLGKVERLSGPERVRILLRWMGSEIPVEVKTSRVAPLSAQVVN